MPRRAEPPDQREQLMEEIASLAATAIFGTLSETYRTCGQPSCRCKRGGPRHGPHLNVSYRGDDGKTTGYYVPKAAEDRVRAGIAAWHTLQQRLRELAELNKQRAFDQAKERIAE